jgi:hypothetical protein
MKNTLLVIAFVLVVGAIGLYVAWTSTSGISSQVPTEVSGEIVASSSVSESAISAEVISGSAPRAPGYDVLYKNDRFGFSFYHTAQGKVSEYDEGQGAMTVVLENDTGVRGLQVFIVPYTESTISEDRFRADVPSGVRENVEDAKLDGVRAVTFTSRDQFLGDTREIWVIRNGYLYEITTLSGGGDWFTPIIQSWHFF